MPTQHKTETFLKGPVYSVQEAAYFPPGILYHYTTMFSWEAKQSVKQAENIL